MQAMERRSHSIVGDYLKWLRSSETGLNYKMGASDRMEQKYFLFLLVLVTHG